MSYLQITYFLSLKSKGVVDFEKDYLYSQKQGYGMAKILLVLRKRAETLKFALHELFKTDNRLEFLYCLKPNISIFLPDIRFLCGTPFLEFSDVCQFSWKEVVTV